MANVTYRASSSPTIPVSTVVKGAPLTNLEVDANFKALNDDLALKATTTYVNTVITTTAADNSTIMAVALG